MDWAEAKHKTTEEHHCDKPRGEGPGPSGAKGLPPLVNHGRRLVMCSSVFISVAEKVKDRRSVVSAVDAGHLGGQKILMFRSIERSVREEEMERERGNQDSNGRDEAITGRTLHIH